MMRQVEPALIAERLRRLIGGSTANFEKLARDLDVSEAALRVSVDELAPRPALEVIVAVVRQHGVDPTWLMFGEYDLDQHRAAVANDDESSAPPAIVQRIAEQLASIPPTTQEHPL